MERGADILVVEDDELLRNQIVEILVNSNRGLDIAWAGDGEKAIRDMEFLMPRLLITDKNLPGEIDGFTLIKKAKELGIPAILMTGEPGYLPMLMRSALQAGAGKVLFKPFGFSEFLESVHSLLFKS